VEQINTALTALVTQLQKLPLPREVARPLKTFAKQLDGRVSQAREIPLLLSELSGLQGQALNNLEPAKPRAPGLLQRLFGTKEVATETAASEPAPIPAPQPVAAKPVVEPQVPEQSEELATRCVPLRHSLKRRLPRSLSLQHRPMSGLPAKRSSTRPRLRWRRLRFPSQVSSPGSPSLRQRNRARERPRRLYRGTCGSA
jgi:hypothetical protein